MISAGQSISMLMFPHTSNWLGSSTPLLTFINSQSFNLHTPNLISFRLMGKCFHLSIVQFSDVLGFSTRERDHPYCEFCGDFDPVTLYAEFCDNPPDTYDLNKSKDLCLHEPCMKYIPRFLAYSFSGRRDAPSVLSKIELLFFMVHGPQETSEPGFLVCIRVIQCYLFQSTFNHHPTGHLHHWPWYWWNRLAHYLPTNSSKFTFLRWHGPAGT